MCRNYLTPRAETIFALDLNCSFVSGVLGIKVKIMLPYDPQGKIGPKKPLPDSVSIVEPKDEIFPSQPTSEVKASKDAPQPTPLAV